VNSLIWKSVVELAATKKSDDEIVFITNNSRDFGDGDGGLHEHLREDLVASDLDSDAVTLMPRRRSTWISTSPSRIGCGHS